MLIKPMRSPSIIVLGRDTALGEDASLPFTALDVSISLTNSEQWIISGQGKHAATLRVHPPASTLPPCHNGFTWNARILSFMYGGHSLKNLFLP